MIEPWLLSQTLRLPKGMATLTIHKMLSLLTVSFTGTKFAKYLLKQWSNMLYLFLPEPAK